MVGGVVVQSHFIVKPNLVLRLGWGFDNSKKSFFDWGLFCRGLFVKAFIGEAFLKRTFLRRPFCREDFLVLSRSWHLLLASNNCHRLTHP